MKLLKLADATRVEKNSDRQNEKRRLRATSSMHSPSALVLALGAAAPVVALAPADAAAQGYNGAPVQAQYLFPDINTNYVSAQNATVSGGVEFPNLIGYPFQIDVADSQIIVTFTGPVTWSTASFNGFRIRESSAAISVTGASFNAAASTPGVPVPTVTSDADDVWINWQSLPYNTGMVLVFNVSHFSSDVTPPTLNITGPNTTQTGPFTVNFNFSENVVGFDASDVIPAVGTQISNFAGSGASYSMTVTRLRRHSRCRPTSLCRRSMSPVRLAR
jgi:hypothetical protein